jgi:peptidoglycan/xylan/chitin deacetylase (PgdA/CDA1 family)
MLKYIAVVMSVLLLCSCGEGNGSKDDGKTAQGNHSNARGKLESLGGNTDSPALPRPEQIKDVNEIEAGDTEPLEGGTERSERPKSPDSNLKLAQRYPDIIALNAPRSSNRIAITFDDGPDRQYTPQVLDILKKYNVKATFFLMGSRVKGHPDITERIHQEGHAIGNHTFWHPKLYDESVERLVWEVEETDEWIKKTVGYAPKLFRAPYGGLTETNVRKLGEMGKSVIGWSIDTQDWRQIPSEEVQRNLMKDLHPGAIILMHCAGDWSQDLSGMTAALDELLPRLEREGYEMVTVPELIGTSYKLP